MKFTDLAVPLSSPPPESKHPHSAALLSLARLRIARFGETRAKPGREAWPHFAWQLRGCTPRRLSYKRRWALSWTRPRQGGLRCPAAPSVSDYSGSRERPGPAGLALQRAT